MCKLYNHKAIYKIKQTRMKLPGEVGLEETNDKHNTFTNPV